jgi:hypothetical protein
MIQNLSRRLLAASALALVACSGKKTPTGTTQPPASISVSSAAPTLSVAQGASGSAALTIARTNYTGDVTLTAEGVPTGVTATFTPATIGAGATTSSVALAVSGTAAAGTSTVTVRARGTGVTDVTTSIALTITATATGTVSLALTPTASTITAGQTAVSTLAITRGGGFAGGVNLTLSGAPTGLTFAFSTSNPVTANSVTLTLTAATSVVPGPYTLTVRGNATGLTEATATYVLTVNAVPSNSVSWRYCNTDRIPSWFAYQDGTTGSWQRVTATSAGQFDFAVGQPTVGIASVYTDRGITVTDVRYYGLTELQAAAAAECTENPVAGTKTINGTVTGFASSSETANVAIGNAVSSIASQLSPAFTIPRVQTGPRDLIAARVNVGANTTTRLLLVRGTNIADNGSTGPLDLGAGTSFAPASATVTITAPNDGTLIGSTSFQTATNTGAALQIGALSSGVASTYQGFPASVLLATDAQRVTITQDVTGGLISRSISRFIGGPISFTMAMPVDPAVPTVTAVSGATYPRATAAGTLPAAFNRQVTVVFDPPATPRRWIMSSTSAARAGSLSYSLTMPDFSQVPGWNTAWQLTTGNAEVNSSFSGQTGAGTSGEAIIGTTAFTISRKTQFTF